MARNQQKKSLKLWKLPLYLLSAMLLLAAGLLLFLTVTEYRPAESEALIMSGAAPRTLSPGDSFTLMSWNLGYGALGDNADFFMDGGSGVITADKARLESNLEGIWHAIQAVQPDILLTQEIDRPSRRSGNMDQVARLQQRLDGYTSVFANNYKTAFVPYPWPPLGKVDSGMATFSSFAVNRSERRQLPISFSWPVRLANLKRGLLVSRLPIQGSDKEVVIINLHLEAYDDGEGKIAQTKMLAQLLEREAAQGHYVIAGGDFNQIFSTADAGKYPAQEGKWAAGKIDVTQISGDWQFLMDESLPSCRSLDQPYRGADKSSFQYYLIDGYIVSGNLQVDYLGTQDLDFVCSDHNPVVLKLTLK